MNSTFVDKNQPTASEYLDASIEEIIERANKSSSESEIPFVTALLAAKAHRDQKSVSNKMFGVAIVTTFVALLALAQSYLESKDKSLTENEIAFLRSELSSLRSELTDTAKQLQSAIRKIDVLEKEREIYLRMAKPIYEASKEVVPHVKKKSHND